MDYRKSVELTDQQERLIPILKNWYQYFWKCPELKPWFALAGAAGTGKTTVIKYFIEEMNIKNRDVICCAYVGKAVSVLATHGLNAKTIHSLIYDMVYMIATDEYGNIKMKEDGTPKMKLGFVKKEQLDYPYQLIVVDEASMVNDALRDDLLSFGVPVIFIGDMNQLPPIFGQSSVMLYPDFILTKIMRQAEDNPIVYLSQMVLAGYPLMPGEYGTSKIVTELRMGENLLSDYDSILVAKNGTREKFNRYIRYKLLGATNDKPMRGEKIICRQNNWNLSIGDGLFLTNGTSGVIEDLGEISKGGDCLKFDFTPDVNGITKRGMYLDYKYIQLPYEERKEYGMSRHGKFEYGYAITTHLSQGSQYNRVLFIDEPFADLETNRKLRYTAITRAIDHVDIVVKGKRQKW